MKKKNEREGERRDVIGYRGERQGEGKDRRGVLQKKPGPCLNEAVSLYRLLAL